MFVSQSDVNSYHQNGYLLIEDLFDAAQIEVLLDAVEHGSRVSANTVEREDNDGRKSRLSIWHELGDDVWSAASTHPSLVNVIRILQGEEIAFFHGKVMLKEAHSGGAWEWHQDYGYWYEQGFVFPRMMSAFVALDASTQENGCLQVLKGSHKLGRLSHIVVAAGQLGSDQQRIEHVSPYFEKVYCEMSPGSVLFFDCNLLHTSAPNSSDYPRRAFIVCYNALNNPVLGDMNNLDGLSKPCPVGSEDDLLKFRALAGLR